MRRRPDLLRKTFFSPSAGILLTEFPQCGLPLGECVVFVDGFLGLTDHVDIDVVRKIGVPFNEALEDTPHDILHELRVLVGVDDDLSFIRSLEELERR